MGELTKSFPSTPPSAIVTLDFAQLASGTGIIEFFAGDTVDKNLISNITFFSNSVLSSSGNMFVSADAQRLDIDYDALVNNQLTMEGTAIVSVPIAAARSGSTTTAHVVIKLRKIPLGGSEELIAENESTLLTNNTVPIKYLMTSTDLTVPNTQFSKGDIIRLTIELWGSGEADPSSVLFAHDPKGRTVGWDGSGDVPSILVMQAPVRIQT